MMELRPDRVGHGHPASRSPDPEVWKEEGFPFQMSIAPWEMGTELTRKLCIALPGSRRVNKYVFQYHTRLIYVYTNL